MVNVVTVNVVTRSVNSPSPVAVVILHLLCLHERDFNSMHDVNNIKLAKN